jgi:uridylate kinase
MPASGQPDRVLLKLSGSALSGAGGSPFDERAIAYIVSELIDAQAGGVQVAVVVGGGNILRGARFSAAGLGRLRADYAGMMATFINALMLRQSLETMGARVSHYGAFAVPRVADAFEPQRCAADLQGGKLVLLAGGTGCPLFTTDTAAALRAAEIGAGLVLKATRVDGIYSADPETTPDAKLIKRVSCAEVLERRLGVMDLTAVSFCLEHGLPVRVFNYAVKGNVRRAVMGEPVGTLMEG